MKSALVFLVVSSLAAAASEVVTLSSSNQCVTVEPTDIVQVVSTVTGSVSTQVIFSKPGEGRSPYLWMAGGNVVNHGAGLTFTGLTRVTLSEPNLISEVITPIAEGNPVAVTLRITKQADQFFSEPVILPAVADQDYTVELQTSTDLESWIPAVPGDYLGGASNRFFRVKVEAKPE